MVVQDTNTMNEFFATADAALQPSPEEAIQRLAAEILRDIDSYGDDDAQHKLTEDAVQHLVASYIERSGVMSQVSPSPYRASLGGSSHIPHEPFPPPPCTTSPFDDYRTNFKLFQDMRSQREAEFTKHLNAISRNDASASHRDDDSASSSGSESASSSGYSSDDDVVQGDAGMIRQPPLATLMDAGCQTDRLPRGVDVGTSPGAADGSPSHRDAGSPSTLAEPSAISATFVQPRCHFPCDVRMQAKKEAFHMSVQTNEPSRPAVKECGIMTSVPSLRDHGTAMSPKSVFVALLKTKAVDSSLARPCEFELDLSNLNWHAPGVP
ncbi:hypothetical protein, variant [Aphanomyces invadans]|uniref:Uncharacterized protein n=1 Tax=Aphanomyces invadans TaxID=157072 RepID=A0A024TDJ3_9STRA|nr:hypothetical protein, variant [Aphanomyces invadans]ETV92128.1 hypothetical protein, variant [Aphanomyces invadans]|eukprot:XP_008879290.1 hypothetical protein, variant [Aphanomyces invadans]